MERVVVVGTSCSGKTTLARRLSQVLGSPHVELDAIHWEPGWQERPVDEVRRMAGEAAAGERWVMDGNYSAVRDIVWGRATAVAWLNYPFRVVLWRCLCRTIRRAITREELFSGNREKLQEVLPEPGLDHPVDSYQPPADTAGVPANFGRRGSFRICGSLSCGVRRGRRSSWLRWAWGLAASLLPRPRDANPGAA